MKIEKNLIRGRARKFKKASSNGKREILRQVLNLPPVKVKQIIQSGDQILKVPIQSRWIKFYFIEDFVNFYFVCDYRKFKEWILTNGNEVRIHDHKKARKKLGDKFKGESWFAEGRWFLKCPACGGVTSLKGSDKFEFGSDDSFKDIVDIWYCRSCRVYSMWWVNYKEGLYKPRVFHSLYDARSHVYRSALLLLEAKGEAPLNGHGHHRYLGMRKFLAKYRVSYDKISQKKIEGKKKKGGK